MSPTIAPPAAKNSALTALLYDLDGTMANTDPFHCVAWQEMLHNHGVEIDEAAYKTRISGRLNPAIVADLLPHLSPTAVAPFIAQKEARYRELASQLPALAGLYDVIDWATAQNLRQGVVTNAPPENVHHTLKTLNLTNRFEPVVIAELLGIGKPDPAPYRHALQQFDLLPEQAIAFEDSPSGIRSAVGAGISTIGIASTQDPQVLYDLGAVLVVADFTDPKLWQLLDDRLKL